MKERPGKGYFLFPGSLEKWQGGGNSSQEKSCRSIRRGDKDNNSLGRRRDENNWRKEEPDAARRARTDGKEKTRDAKWQEYLLHGTTGTTHN